MTDGLDGASNRGRLDLGAQSAGQGIDAAGLAQGALDVNPGHPLAPVVAQVGVIQGPRRFISRIGHLGNQRVIGTPPIEWREKSRDLDGA